MAAVAAEKDYYAAWVDYVDGSLASADVYERSDESACYVSATGSSDGPDYA